MRSVFYLHNESVNIWSHLLPTLAYLVVLLATDYSTLRDEKNGGVRLSTADNAVLQTYIAGSVVCLMFSVGVYFPPSVGNEKNWSSSLTPPYTGLVSYRCCTLGAGRHAVPEVGLSGHLAECRRLRHHLHLCRPLRQAWPSGFLHLAFRPLRHIGAFRRLESARRRTAGGSLAVSLIFSFICSEPAVERCARCSAQPLTIDADCKPHQSRTVRRTRSQRLPFRRAHSHRPRHGRPVEFPHPIMDFHGLLLPSRDSVLCHSGAGEVLPRYF